MHYLDNAATTRVLPEARTDSAIRVSFAPFNTKEDVDAFINAAQKGVKMLRR